MENKEIPVGVSVWWGAAQHFVFLDLGQQPASEPSVIDVAAPGAAVPASPADPAHAKELIIVVAPKRHRPRSRYKWTAGRDIVLMGARPLASL